ncbi:hypothetical protein [Sphingomonas nostoxanthinifaciens]|uniref:hypothetical protein n=1 Tax=Sphingomonas nostoxanthinifaciens TaxID=2872652 RepID=UPI001CC1FCCE|nr:hypothetical protein [Sphingomonas nostoxanthinifaciens]UAK25784.1 hypothetical protein K8P63_06545 [Sphingomonas nostoxanthinifaciens]
MHRHVWRADRAAAFDAKGAQPRDPIIVLLLAIVACAARAATFDNPALGFDEQFYLLVGDRMLHGALPYVDIFDRKPIGIFLIYAGTRFLGGSGFLQYKLVAACIVALSAYGIFRIVRTRASSAAAIASAVAYILWLDFMEGEGGQTPVFYNLAMLAAAALILSIIRQPRLSIWRGTTAMLCVGLALQIKYSVAPEGALFGLALLYEAHRRDARWVRTIGLGFGWAGLALLPTVAAYAAYAAEGHGSAFLFANFQSVMGQRRRPFSTEAAGLALIAATLAPLLICAIRAREWRSTDGTPSRGGRFLASWLAAASASMLLYGRFDAPHYAIPLLLPLTLLSARAFDSSASWRRGIYVGLVVAFVAGQAVLETSRLAKGGRSEATAVAAAAAPTGRCIFVYDAYPALYMLAQSCLPTKWAFPGHLSTQDEADARALGVDPTAEVRRIMAARPAAVIDTYPRFAFTNRATRAILSQELAVHYDLADCVASPLGTVRLVYRPRGDRHGAAPHNCPSPTMLTQWQQQASAAVAR